MHSMLLRVAVAFLFVTVGCGCGGSRSAAAPLKVTRSLQSSFDGVVTKSSTTMGFTYVDDVLDSVAVSSKADGVTEKWKVNVAYTDDLVTEINVSYDGGTYRRTYSYDEDDRVELARGSMDGKRDTTRYEYDEDGQLTRTTYTDSDGADTERSYRYDSDGRLEGMDSDSDSVEYTYDDDDRLDRVTTDAGSPTFDFDYEYDDDGRVSAASSQDVRYTVTYGDDDLIDEVRAKFDLSTDAFSASLSITTRVEWADLDVLGIVFYPPVPEGWLFDVEGAPFTSPHTGLGIGLAEFE